MSETDIEPGADMLFKAITRPQMKLGVSVNSLVLNLLTVAMIVNWTDLPILYALLIPIHGIFYFVCKKDPFFFDILLLGLRNGIYSLLPSFKLRGTKPYVGT